jgi:hypothetical protein
MQYFRKLIFHRYILSPKLCEKRGSNHFLTRIVVFSSQHLVSIFSYLFRRQSMEYRIRNPVSSNTYPPPDLESIC